MYCSALHDPPEYVLYAKSRVVMAESTPYTSRTSPLSCSYATSNRFWEVPGAADHTCPMLFEAVQPGEQTYASSHPSSLTVTNVRVPETVGDHAMRTPRMGLAAVDRKSTRLNSSH